MSTEGENPAQPYFFLAISGIMLDSSAAHRHEQLLESPGLRLNGETRERHRRVLLEGAKMEQFEFNKNRIDQHMIRIGVDVRPPIELALDSLRIQEFYNQVSDQFPKLFADLSQSKTKFQISKEIPIPGKGKITVPTFTLTQRGPVFNFPITLPDLLEDHEWSKTLNADVIKCLAMFNRHLPGTKFFRIGKVRNLVFRCESAKGRELFRKQFCPYAPDESEELVVEWNAPDEQYNRKIAAKAVEKKQVIQQDIEGTVQPIPVPQGEHGIGVTFDVNTRRFDVALDLEQMKIILDHADDLFNGYLYDVLKRKR